MAIFKIVETVYVEAEYDDEAYDYWFEKRDYYSMYSTTKILEVQFQDEPRVRILKVPEERF